MKINPHPRNSDTMSFWIFFKNSVKVKNASYLIMLVHIKGRYLVVWHLPRTHIFMSYITVKWQFDKITSNMKVHRKHYVAEYCTHWHSLMLVDCLQRPNNGFVNIHNCYIQWLGIQWEIEIKIRRWLTQAILLYRPTSAIFISTLKYPEWK